jgi:uncharacterized UBP type Zn finger protein
LSDPETFESPVPCEHLRSVRVLPAPGTDECADCVSMGDRWVHLRMCVECGHVGCCDSSKNRHASGHYRGGGHPVMRGIEPGERWLWCYEDRDSADL